MNSAADRRSGFDNPDAPLVDVSELSFSDLLARVATPPHNDSALSQAIRRTMHETTTGNRIVAAFGNFAPDDPTPAPAS